MAFQPHIDYGRITDDQVLKYGRMVAEWVWTNQLLSNCWAEIAERGEDDKRTTALRVLVEQQLKMHDDLVEITTVIDEDCRVWPALVHVAGEPHEDEATPEAPEGAWTQDCVRCGSWLMRWSPSMYTLITPEGPRVMGVEDMNWWPEGTQIAKSEHGFWPITQKCPNCEGQDPENVWYQDCQVCDNTGRVRRELDPAERECVGFDAPGLT